MYMYTFRGESSCRTAKSSSYFSTSKRKTAKSERLPGSQIQTTFFLLLPKPAELNNFITGHTIISLCLIVMEVRCRNIAS